MKKINILRILFVIILGIIAFFALSNPKKVETNLLKAFFSNGAKDEVLVDLSGKYSSNINVLFESENLELLEKALDTVLPKHRKHLLPLNFKALKLGYEYDLLAV